MKSSIALVFVVSLLAGGRALGDAAPPSVVPSPPKQLESLRFLVGKWKCSGDAAGSPFWAPHKTEATTTVSVNPGAFWLRTEYEEKKTHENAHPIHATDYFTYHAGMKKYVRVWISALGDFGTATADDWQGDKLVFSGDQMLLDGGKAPSRFTLAKEGDKKFAVTLEMEKDGKWVPLGSGTCTK